MKVLSINTTGVGTQISLTVDNQDYFVDAGFSKHSETLFPLIEKLLDDAKTTIEGTDYFGVVVGPGSFTGIRIGVAVAKTFAYVNDAKCVAVNSLEVLAYNIFEKKEQLHKTVCAVINAGANMLYYQLFEKNGITLLPLCSPKVCLVKHFFDLISKVYNNEIDFVYCNNNEKVKSIIDEKLQSENFSANALKSCVLQNIKKNNVCDLLQVQPIYLRACQAENFVFCDEDIEIEMATKNDIDNICNLETEDDPEDLPWSKISIEQSFDNPSFLCWMLKARGNVLGYISVMNLSDEFEILRIVVHKNARLKGVATRLINFVSDYAKKNGAISLLLEVNDHNYPALSLYETMGFKKVGERKQYYSKNENALLLKKAI